MCVCVHFHIIVMLLCVNIMHIALQCGNSTYVLLFGEIMCVCVFRRCNMCVCVVFLISHLLLLLSIRL